MFSLKKLNRVYLLFTLVTLTLGCNKARFSTENIGDELIRNFCVDYVENECHRIVHEQQGAKMDILFVTDTSGSLDHERNDVADGIEDFISHLPPSLDYNVGVILAHGSTSSYSGQLYSYGTEPVVLKSSELTGANIKSELRKKLTIIKNDTKAQHGGIIGSDGGEEGLFSLAESIKPTNLANAQSVGMFRADSPLTVIFISDENDICARYPNDIVRVNDPDGEELPAFIRDCENITPAGVHAQFKNLKGTQPLIVSAIVYTDPATTPAGGENEVGYGYTDIVNINGGVLVDMAENNISGGMGVIGGQSAFQIGFLASFGLCGPSSDLNVSSLIVQVDGQNAPFTYDPDTNIVHLDNPGDVGDVVTINYCPNVIADGLGDGTGPDSQ